MNTVLPEIPPETLVEWQRVVDLTARLARVPASLIMRTERPTHTVLVSSRTEGNPYAVGREYDLHAVLYCQGVFDNDGELVVEDATRDPVWAANEDLADGMRFYIGYPLKWPSGEVFGTICVLDRERNDHALLFREGLQAFAGVVEATLRALVEIAERRRLETALQHSLDQTALQVVERTSELQDANTALRVLLGNVEQSNEGGGRRRLVRGKYRRLFSSSARPKKPGPKGPSESLIRAIVELTSRNPRFGCTRIARIISQTFGVDIDKNVVHRVLAKRYRPAPGGTGPSWLSFVGHTTDSLWSVDLFRCESIVLQSYWVLVVMDQFTRRLVGFGVHRGPVDAPSLCRMCNAAIHGRGAPRHLSTDHDRLFEAHRWTANLRLLEIDEIKTVPHVPLSHPFVERLIGTMRREFLDHVLFWSR